MNLPSDIANEILKSLLEQGIISQEDIDEYILKSPDQASERDTDWLHFILCHDNHDSGECEYYNEEGLDVCWTKPSHVRWISRLLSIIKTFKVNNFQREIVSKVSIIESSLIDSQEGHRNLILLLLDKKTHYLLGCNQLYASIPVGPDCGIGGIGGGSLPTP